MDDFDKTAIKIILLGFSMWLVAICTIAGFIILVLWLCHVI